MTLTLSSRTKLILAGVLAFVMLTIFILAGISMYLLREQSTTPFARRFANIFPVPAARVNGDFMLYRDVLARWDTVDVFVKNAPVLAPNQQIPDLETLRQQTFEQIIRESYIQTLAKNEKFSIEEAALDQNVNQFIERSSSTKAEFEQYLRQNYELSLQQFRDRIIGPATLEQAMFQRAGLGGVSEADWRQQIRDALKSGKIVRYLRFSKPLPEEVVVPPEALEKAPE